MTRITATLVLLLTITGFCSADQNLVTERIVLKEANATELAQWLQWTLGSNHEPHFSPIPTNNSIKVVHSPYLKAAHSRLQTAPVIALIQELDHPNTPIDKKRDSQGDLTEETRLFIPVEETIDDVAQLLEKHFAEITQTVKLTTTPLCIIGKGKPSELDRLQKYLSAQQVNLLETRVWRLRSTADLKRLNHLVHLYGGNHHFSIEVLDMGTESHPQSTSNPHVMIVRASSTTFDRFDPQAKINDKPMMIEPLRFQLLGHSLIQQPPTPSTPAVIPQPRNSSVPTTEHLLVKLKHVSAAEVAVTIRALEVLEPQGRLVASAGNSIIIRGTKQKIDEARELIEMLDRASESEQKPVPTNDLVQQLMSALASRRLVLQNLQQTFSDNHPETQLCLTEIRTLEQELKTLSPKNAMLVDQDTLPSAAEIDKSDTPEIEHLNQEYEAAESEVQSLVSQWKEIHADDASDETRLRVARMKIQLEAAVKTAFLWRLKLQNAQLDTAQTDLQTARQRLQQRKHEMGPIVKSRLEELTSAVTSDPR